MPLARQREIDDSQILEAARKIFIQSGLSAPVRTIARSLGISDGVIFQRFGTKDALIKAALDTSGADLEAPAGSQNQSDPARGFEDLAAAMFHAIRRLAPAALPLLAGPHPSGLTSPDGAFLRCRSVIADHLKKEEAAGRIAPGASAGAAFQLAAVLHHAALYEAVAGPTPMVSEQTIRQMARALWFGVGVPGAGAGSPRATQR